MATAGPRRIAFLRSIEVQQAAPFLEPLRALFSELDIEARLFYTDGDVGPADWPGTAERIPAGADVTAVVSRLMEWGADGVISLSIPDENALRDSLIVEELTLYGVRAMMHGVALTECLSNKWATKQAVTAAGLRTPPGVLMDGDLLDGRCLPVPAYRTALTRQAYKLGFPLVSKPLWDCLGNGIRFIADDQAWARFLESPFEGNAVLEQCLTGELYSVEIIGRGGDYVVQPLILKGPTGGSPSHIFRSVRYSCARPEADRDFAPVRDRLIKMCDRLGAHGALEVEMIYAGGEYWIIEINPRVSGSTALSVAASGCNTYLCLLKMLVDGWGPERADHSANGWPKTERRRTAVQLPLATFDAGAMAAARRELAVLRASTFTVQGVAYANMPATCEHAERPTKVGALERLTAEYGLLERRVLTEIQAVLEETVPLRSAPLSQLTHLPSGPVSDPVIEVELCLP
jgi:carbamoylphosphate synthase large subunit